MKQKVLIAFLAIEAVVCLVLYGMRTVIASAFTTMMAFPFEQIGLLLRQMSLSGVGGNIAAIALLLLLSALPTAALLWIRGRRDLQREDGLLGILSALLLAVLYLMVNPSQFGGFLGGAGQWFAKALAGGTVYSVVVAYGVLRISRLCSGAEPQRLQRYLSGMLCALCAVFVYSAFGAGFSTFLENIAALRTGNVGNENLLTLSYVFLFLRFVVDALPYVMDVWVALAAHELLQEMQASQRSEATNTAARKLSRRCIRSLALAVLSNAALNVAQLLFSKHLMSLNGVLQIPVVSVAFVLMILLLSQLVCENKQLREDNDLFI